ncbi:MAG: Excinuclease ABC C subunit domain protein [Parcubacteria group bacterium GW2011_GWB1_46_8]|nr:MAG: Excinuclease ABC C subunit domain protein [Parcubacteria group bacterium GW2011_GWF1_45_5]KKU43996.1 MAG: Excinuclease ABC C subunit domain protein [Parcubacteria group bacterium GW2011_GWA2_46_7]KKU46153.1 MAG: Excinuclease ABC C subunit domain protein [Parcubacteria group bacterium GW2011_GWB1_46_8]
MHTVYVLRSLEDGKLYIGCTNALGRRLSEHNNGRVKSTVCRKPFCIVYKEIFSDRYIAFRKERYYKTAKGKKELLKLIESSTQCWGIV